MQRCRRERAETVCKDRAAMKAAGAFPESLVRLGTASQENDPERRQMNARRRAPVMIATIATGVGLSVGAFQLGQRIELTRIQATFERTAGERIAAVEARLLATIGSLRALSSFFEATGEVSPDQFRKFVSPLLNAYAGVQAFEWVPLVSADHIANRRVPSLSATESISTPHSPSRSISARCGKRWSRRANCNWLRYSLGPEWQAKDKAAPDCRWRF